MSADALIVVNNPLLAEPLQNELSKLNFTFTISTKIPKTTSQSYRYLVIIASEKPSLAQSALSYLQKNPFTKTILVFSINKENEPPQKLTQKLTNFQNKNKNLKIVYTGDLLAPGYLAKSALGKALVRISQGKHVNFSSPNFDFCFTLISDLTQPLLHDLFSYTDTNNTLYASKISSSSLSPMSTAPKIQTPKYSLENKILTKLPASQNEINEIIRSFPEKPKRFRPHFKFRKKTVVFGGFLLLWSLILPLVMLFISAATFLLSAKTASTGKLKLSLYFSQTSHLMATLGETGFQIQSRAPLIKSYTEPALAASRLLSSGSSLAIRFIKLSQTSEGLLANVFTKSNVNLEEFSKELYLELDLLYKDASFLEAHLKNFSNLLAINFPQFDKYSTYRQYLYSGRETASVLPELLGSQSPATYLILFQNNMELRPTGGFIGSFALATIQNGQLIDLPIYDVYTADGQLKGFVKPPQPISDYLGEESWYLRDSNWDPDFTVSAKRAEWFLDKSLDRSVNGVIAVDLDFLKDLLKVTGPVYLADFDDEITEENFYHKVQYEVENDFFPGSRKKANYLSALTSALFSRLTNLDSNAQIQVARLVVNSLNTKSLQVYLNNDKMERVANVLGWSGEVLPITCQGNCHPYWLGLVEANLGVNKANLFINRKAEITVSLQDKIIKSSLDLSFQNTNPEINKAPEFRYKNYLRLLLPSNATSILVTLNQNGKTSSPNPDINFLFNRLEAGFLLDIPPSSEAKINIQWIEPTSLDLTQNHGQFRFFWRKQAGVSNFPATIFLRFPNDFGLTKGKLVRYNTNLSQDFETTFTW